MEKVRAIAVAGAAGFVGKALIQKLPELAPVVALTRGSNRLANDPEKRIEWRNCDLFSIEGTAKALRGCDSAVYLVHSMLPAAQLTQANFENLDLLVADNFAQAAAEAGVKQIVYVGGIIPQDTTLSVHLQSRLEVEVALGAWGVPVTTLRAAMIFGPDGSSMHIVAKLVKRLPLMICPAWTSTRSRPIYLDDVVSCILFCLNSASTLGKSYDIGGSTLVSYRDMMQQVGKRIGKNPVIVTVPLLSPTLSRLWVSLITGAPKNLIGPLIETLRYDMMPQESRLLTLPNHRFLSFSEILDRCFSTGGKEIHTARPRAFQLPDDERSRRTVRSVQRLFKPQGMTARDAADEYLRWLPRFLNRALRVEVEEERCRFYLFNSSRALLELILEKNSPGPDCVQFRIVGGLLVKFDTVGRLEFRCPPKSDCLIAAIHDYHPRLPWFVYVLTQAKVHLWVMRAFEKHLRRHNFSV